MTRLAVVVAASVPFVSGLFWLYLYAVYTEYYGTFGVTLEQVGLTQSTILARAGGRALLGIILVGGYYLFVVACARAVVDAGSRSSWVRDAFSSSNRFLCLFSGRPAGARVPWWFVVVACATLMLVGFSFLALAAQFQDTEALLLFVLLGLTAVLIAGAVMGVDEWDRGAWWRSVIRYLRVSLIALLVLGIGLVSYTSVGTARSAALRTLGTSVQDDGLTGMVLLLEEGEAYS